MSAYASPFVRGPNASNANVVYQNEVGARPTTRSGPAAGSAPVQSFFGNQKFTGNVINRNIYEGSGHDIRTPLQTFQGYQRFDKGVNNTNAARLRNSAANGQRQQSRSGSGSDAGLAAPLQAFEGLQSFQGPVANTNTVDAPANIHSAPVQSYRGQQSYRGGVTNNNALNIQDDGIRVRAVQSRYDDDGIRVSAVQSFEGEQSFQNEVHNTNAIHYNSSLQTPRLDNNLIQTFSGRENFMGPVWNHSRH